MRPFANRVDGGRQLARALAALQGRPDLMVLGLPRGGVPVAAEVARALGSPLDVFLVRKIGVPGHEELAMGAIAEGGVEVLNDRLIAELGIPAAVVNQVAARERVELERRQRVYRGDRTRPDVTGRTVIVVDDGLATGATMEAAILALRKLGPAAVIAAAPVGAGETCARLRTHADQVVCAEVPDDFGAVGEWYRDFDQTTDEEVRRLIAAADPPRR
jgi:predicted phosphoribosyltransferase